MKLPRRRHFLHLAAGAPVLPAVRVAWAQLRGDLQALANDRFSAEASFLDAIAIARRQNAKIFELRSAMSLARLWRDQGRRAEAKSTLPWLFHLPGTFMPECLRIGQSPLL